VLAGAYLWPRRGAPGAVPPVPEPQMDADARR
jgi:hypothetical protein